VAIPEFSRTDQSDVNIVDLVYVEGEFWRRCVATALDFFLIS